MYKLHSPLETIIAGPGKKAKRVSDVNALGGPQTQTSLTPNINQGINNMQQQSPAPNFYTPNSSPMNYGQQPQYTPEFQSQNNFQYAPSNQPEFQKNSQFDMAYQPQQGPSFAMFQQPIVQDMAYQYGKNLADQGKELVHKEFEKYVSVSKLKYYFAVDNSYVLNKMRLIFFPFAQKDWSLKFDQVILL